MPTVPADETDLLVVGGVAQTRSAIAAAHRPDAAGKSCRECRHVYGGVRVCPAAAEALEGCAALIASAPPGPVEIVHLVCGPRRRSGTRGWLLVVAALVATAGLVASLATPLPEGVRLVVPAVTPVCVWVLFVAWRREARREREARAGDVLEPYQ